jgi:superfamily I DNA and/or RNA helicase/very-short-patch-repair endonuclease
MSKQLLEKARLDLLDLGLRNNFINTRDSKNMSLRVIEESSLEVLKILVDKGYKMSFNSKKDVKDEDNGEFGALFELPPLESIDSDKLTDNILQTNHSDQDLQKRLRSVDRLSRLSIEEKGVNMLFLAVGFVRWYESENSDKARLAPLILIPVRLDRPSVNSRFKVSYNDDDLGINISFFEKLKTEFGIKINYPNEVDSSSLSSFIEDIKAKISLKRWEVLENEIRLGLFSFSKFLMYNDLDEKQWGEDEKPFDHTLLGSLLGNGFEDEGDGPLSDEDLFDSVSYSDTFHVLPSDSSQQEVIFSVRSGLNTIVQGPPGTGKSQTITNIISDFLARGKKVLFVAEKLAALRVVSNKLEALGVDKLALELHSNKANKKAFIEELGKVMSLDRPVINIDIAQELSSAENTRQVLNDYAKEVNSEIGAFGFTPIQAFGRVLSLAEKLGQDGYEINLDRVKLESREAFAQKESLIREISGQLQQAGPLESSPFKNLRPSSFTFYDAELFIGTLKKIQPALGLMAKAFEELNTTYSGFLKTDSLNDARILFGSLEAISELPENRAQVDLSKVTKESIENLILVASEALSIKQRVDEASGLVYDKFWEADTFQQFQSLSANINSWYKFLIPSYRKSKNFIKGYIKNGAKSSDQDIFSLCQLNVDLHEINSKIKSLKPLLGSITKEGLQSYNDNWQNMLNTLTWHKGYVNKIDRGLAYRQGLELVWVAMPKPQIKLEEIELLYSDIKSAFESASFDHETGYESLALSQLGLFLHNWIENEAGFVDYVQLCKKLDLLQENGLEWVQEILENWEHSDKMLLEIFRFYWFKALARESFKGRPTLDRFIGDSHFSRVSDYCKAEDLLLQVNTFRVMEKHWEGIPKSTFSAGKLGDLRKELSKKRKHKSIRRLISDSGEVIQDLKPIFLMSPMSVAQFIERNSLSFDLVIFDEASQIRPVEAFGSILRAKQFVVVGDSKQLPPTSFFDSAAEEDDEEVEDSLKTSDVESILALASAKNLPEKMLRWHYRSKHESLITVSNREFYHSNLLVFPSADSMSTERGLEHIHSKGAFFEPGIKGGRVNRGEAKLIVQKVIKHALSNKGKTLGVVAFSQSQAKIINDYLEQELRINHNPEAEKFLFEMHENERFFVKNLENVQGDERDVIIISVGYGYQESGRFTYKFGPINQEGGERRLNVLFSRAKEKCIVYSNFRGDELDLTRTDSYGVKVLKSYLVYAERRELELPESTDGVTDSYFEEYVSEMLIKNGFEITNQVGAASFRIDIGVKHPTEKGRYVIAVECDGAQYHSSKIARDRDKSRQFILESLGWTFYRIWSTDWFLNPERETNKLIEAVNYAIQNGVKNPKTLAVSKVEIGFDASVEEPRLTSEYQKYFKEIHLYDELHNFTGLNTLIKSIIKHEQPVHRDVILMRVLELTGVARAGKRIQSAFDWELQRVSESEGIIKSKDFYHFDIDTSSFSPDGLARHRGSLERKEFKLEYVSDLEIKNAILHLVQNSYGVKKDELLIEVPKIFGFKVIKDDQKKIIESKISSLMRSKVIVSENEVLRILI